MAYRARYAAAVARSFARWLRMCYVCVSSSFFEWIYERRVHAREEKISLLPRNEPGLSSLESNITLR